LKTHIKKHKDATGTKVVVKGKRMGTNSIADNAAAARK
jgi:hypothetical protein